MSGAEAALVLGVISSALSILEAAYQVYDAANDVRGLTKTFRATADQIPLVLHALELAKKSVGAKSVSDEALEKALPVLKQCEKDANLIKDVFDKVLPSENATRSEKYKKAAMLKLKSGTVKKSMQQVMENLALLSQHRVFEDAETLEDIKAGVNQLKDVSEEEPSGSVHHGSGNIINHSGHGNIEDHEYNNSGSGSIYKANSMVFVTKGAALGTRSQEQRSSLLQWISMLDYTAHHKSEISKLLPSTCEWLFERIEYQKWYHEQCTSRLWLHGINGFGKTALMAKIIDSLLQRRQSDMSVVVFFYCSSTSQDRNNLSIDALLRCFLHQIVTTSPDLEIAPEVWRMHQEREKRGFGDRPLDPEECITLVVPLLTAYTEAYFAVDGIDECEPSLREGLLQAMDRIVKTSNIPVKLIVSGRDNQDLLARLRDWPDIALRPGDNARDTERYISETISNRLNSGLLCGGAISEVNRTNVQNILRQKANGMFRWVSSSIEYVCANATLEGDIEEALNQLPPELTLMNDLIFRQILASLNHTRSIALKTFIWLTTAEQELDPVCFLSAISVPVIPLDNSLTQRTVTVDDVIRACRTLVVFDVELQSFRFSHASVKEYLQLSIPSYWLNATVRHTVLAKVCLDLMSPKTESPLYWYSRIWWAKHCSLSKTGRSPDGIAIQGITTRVSIYEPFKSFLDDDYAGSDNFREYCELMISVFGNDWSYTATSLLPDVVGLRSHGQETIRNFQKLGDMRWAELAKCCHLFTVCVWGFRELLPRKPFRKPDENIINALNYDGITCLGLAVRYGHKMIVQALISLEADVNAGKSLCPIHIAATQGDVNFLDLACQSTHSKLELNRRMPSDGSTALMLAAENLHADFAKRLIKLGAHVALRDSHGRTALHRLVRCADSSSALMMVSILLESGKLVNLIDTQNGLTALHMCIWLNKGFLLPCLLDASEIDVNLVSKMGGSAFDIAMSAENPFAVKLLLAHPRLKPISIMQRRAYLYSVALKGLPDLLKILLKQWYADMAQMYPNPGGVAMLAPVTLSYHHGAHVQSGPGRDGVIHYNGDVDLSTALDSELVTEQSALVSAVLCGNRAAIEICVEGETMVKTPDAAGRTALWWALSIGQKRIACKIISAGSSDLNAQDVTWRYSPLHVAVLQDQIDIGRILLSQPGIALNARDDLGQTPLIWACRLGRLDFADLLLSSRGKEQEPFDVEAIDHETGRTAFLWACYQGHTEIAKLLTTHGVSLTAVDWDGCCALSLAILEHAACLGGDDPTSNMRYEATETWLTEQNSLDLNTRDILGRTPLWLAAATDNVECLSSILSTSTKLDLCESHAANLDQQNVLAAAAINGYLRPIRFLRERKDFFALATAQDSSGKTPLSLAALHGHKQVVDYLLSQDTSLALTEDKKLRNPIFLAVQSGNTELVSSLLKVSSLSERAGSLDSHGRSAFSMAVEFGYVGIARLLYEHEPSVLTVPDKRNRLPLVHAAAGGHTSTVQYLLSLNNHGCSLIDQGSEDRPAQRAADNGFWDLALTLVNHDCIDGIGKAAWANIICYPEGEVQGSHTFWEQTSRFSDVKNRRSLLSLACGSGNLSLVKSFFAHFSSEYSQSKFTYPSHPDHDGHTPIWFAVQNGHKRIVWEYITMGALAADDWELVAQQRPEWVVEYRVVRKYFRTMDTTGSRLNCNRSSRFTESPAWQRPWTKAFAQKVDKLVRSFSEYKYARCH